MSTIFCVFVKSFTRNMPLVVSSSMCEIVVDVTELGVGKTIFVGDLEFENLKFITPATTAVCAVRVTRASRGAAEAAK